MRDSHRTSHHTTSATERVKLLVADTMGHSLVPLQIPRVVANEQRNGIRHQIQLFKLCAKCGMLQASLQRLRPCGAPPKKPRGKTAGGLSMVVARVKRDSKKRCPPPKGYEKEEIQALYANALEVLTKEIPTYRQ